MAVAEDKKRVFITFPKDDIEQMQVLADSLNLTLSGLVSMCMHAVLQQDIASAFKSVVDSLGISSL